MVCAKFNSGATIERRGTKKIVRTIRNLNRLKEVPSSCNHWEIKAIY